LSCARPYAVQAWEGWHHCPLRHSNGRLATVPQAHVAAAGWPTAQPGITCLCICLIPSLEPIQRTLQSQAALRRKSSAWSFPPQLSVVFSSPIPMRSNFTYAAKLPLFDCCGAPFKRFFTRNAPTPQCQLTSSHRVREGHRRPCGITQAPDIRVSIWAQPGRVDPISLNKIMIST